MAVDHVKSIQVTNLDAKPIVPLTAGEGGPGNLKIVEGYATTVASGSQDATYQMVRVPSNCKVKQVWYEGGAQAAGTFDIGVYYATDGEGQKPLTLLAANAIDQDFFASIVAVTSAVALTNVTNESGTYTIDKRVQPLWQAVGLTADPGGYFDICITIVTAITTGATVVGLTVIYTD